MRKARLIQASGGVYHITSRIIQKQFLLNNLEKDLFRQLMWQLADFSGITVLTHCFMTNHFHLLIEVPDAPETISEDEIEQRLKALSKSKTALRSPAETFRHQLNVMRAQQAVQADVDRFCDQYRDRMFNLTAYVKELKQRFSQNYNNRHKRKGPLWEERFKSTLLEPAMRPLLEVAAYIDLNPVRAGICTKPERYRFCGYSGALAGDPRCIEGYARLFAMMGIERSATDEQVLAIYRMALFGRATENVPKGRAGVPEEVIRAVLAAGGKLGVAEKLQHRIRYYSEGIIIGGLAFVEGFAYQLQKQNQLKRQLKPHVVQSAPLQTLSSDEALVAL